MKMKITERQFELMQGLAQQPIDTTSSQTIAKPIVSSSLVKVYEALYNSMTWESSYGTLSIHLSKEGAEKAIAFHKMEQIKEWEKLYPNEDDKPYKFGEFEDWAVREVDVLP